MIIPSFLEIVKTAEIILSSSLGGEVKISTYNRFEEELCNKIIAIDHEKFSKNLWYNHKELKRRFKKPGFFCLIVSLNGEPIAYDFGYNNEFEGDFFSDSSATMIEKKGVGTILAVLELSYLYENGYKTVKFYTEEVDQAGRPLRLIWEKMGYRTVSSDPFKGVLMMLEITPIIMMNRIEKYIQLGIGSESNN